VHGADFIVICSKPSAEARTTQRKSGHWVI
jgi:hypothetical protein